jgi:hypothetical protein
MLRKGHAVEAAHAETVSPEQEEPSGDSSEPQKHPDISDHTEDDPYKPVSNFTASPSRDDEHTEIEDTPEDDPDDTTSATGERSVLDDNVVSIVRDDTDVPHPLDTEEDKGAEHEKSKEFNETKTHTSTDDFAYYSMFVTYVGAGVLAAFGGIMAARHYSYSKKHSRTGSLGGHGAGLSYTSGSVS